MSAILWAIGIVGGLTVLFFAVASIWWFYEARKLIAAWGAGLVVARTGIVGGVWAGGPLGGILVLAGLFGGFWTVIRMYDYFSG